MRVLFMLILLLVVSGVCAQELSDFKQIKVENKIFEFDPSYASFTMHDVDNDGLDDLVIGTYGGVFTVYKNIGSKTKPIYKFTRWITSTGEGAWCKNW